MRWLASGFDAVWNDARQRAVLLGLVRMPEKDTVALGMSPHLMAVAHKE
jgi:hypothetical protein